MVGDSLNDAPAITESDFGIAILSAGGHVVTQEKASSLVHEDSLYSVANAFIIANQTVHNIKQNFKI